MQGLGHPRRALAYVQAALTAWRAQGDLARAPGLVAMDLGAGLHEELGDATAAQSIREELWQIYQRAGMDMPPREEAWRR